MMIKISDLHIAREEALPPPSELHATLPVGDAEALHIARSRGTVQQILAGGDDRLLVIAGPCSIHEPESALEYARRLRDFAPQVADALFLVMRVYFEKPRTRLGWKGLIYDPDLDGRGNIRQGLSDARRLLLECARLGVPAGSEILDLVTPQYYAELLAWGAIGARTTESPLHRQMASALSAPVGFKNPTSGTIQTAIDAIIAAAQPHKFPSISLDGRAIVVTTTGNLTDVFIPSTPHSPAPTRPIQLAQPVKTLRPVSTTVQSSASPPKPVATRRATEQVTKPVATRQAPKPPHTEQHLAGHGRK